VHSVKTDDAQVIPVQNAPINHVFCCDVSGSMYGSLPKMRQQLKNRISEIVKPQDTITIIAFSSSTVCYVLKELAEVNTPEQLSALQAAIDRYLVPNGWTDFVPPIKATEKLINSYPGSWNWIFLSDGCHNEGPFSDVVNALTALQGKVINSTIIEYGYYADSARLSEMASMLGGTKIQAEDFDTYVPVFESAIKGTVSAPMVEVDVSDILDSLKYPQFIYINNATQSVHVVTSKDGKVLVPSYVDTIITISKKVVGTNKKSKASVEYYYALAYVMADLLKYDTVEEVLASLGDTKFIDMYQDAFGKQKLFAFQGLILNAIFDESLRGTIDENYVPVDTSYCVIDFFNDLMSDDNSIKVVDPAFAYKRIGAKSVDKVELTEAEKAKLASAKTKKDLDKVMETAEERAVKMSMINKGYPVSDFTWNEERANLSALMKIDVILDLPKNDVGLTQIQSFVFRNYTIIKDGVLNINSLPVILSEKTFESFKNNPRLVLSDVEVHDDDSITTYECIVDISALPVVNRKRVRSSKMKKMTKLALQLNDYKFQLKYLGYLKKELGISDSTSGNTGSTGFTAEQWTYLESLGITSKNGYAPKKEVDKNGDYYMALTLNSTFKGFSSIPAIEAIDKKIKAGKKLTASEDYLQKVMAFIDKKYLSNLKGDAYKDAIKSAFTALTIKKRKVAEELSQMKFAMIISRKWFSDCESFDDNIDTIVSDFGPELTIEYRFVDKKQNL
jgi:hypothetical protein